MISLENMYVIILSAAVGMSRGRENVGGKNRFSYCFTVLLWQFTQMPALEGVACTPSAPSPLETMMQSMFWGRKEPGELTGCPSCAASVQNCAESPRACHSDGGMNPCQISAWFNSSWL